MVYYSTVEYSKVKYQGNILPFTNFCFVSSLFFKKADSEETESLNSDSSCDEKDLDFDNEEDVILTSEDDHGTDLDDQVGFQFQSKSACCRKKTFYLANMQIANIQT